MATIQSSISTASIELECDICSHIDTYNYSDILLLSGGDGEAGGNTSCGIKIQVTVLKMHKIICSKCHQEIT